MTCQNCQVDVHNSAKFCVNCGNSLISVKADDYEKPLKKVLLIFIVLLLYILIINWIEYEANYINTLIVDSLFAVLVLTITLFDWKTYLPLFKPQKVNWTLMGLILVLTPLFSYGVSILVDYLNKDVFDLILPNLLYEYSDSPAPFTIALISVALFPALFEELAFRGVVFHEFKKIASVQGAIIVSAVMFTLLHLSVFSILWILPIGLFTAYLRYKSDTLWYGIVLHFVYNGTFVVLEYFKFGNDLLN